MTKCSGMAFLSFVFAAVVACTGAAQAQTANTQKTGAQFDIGGSFYHAFTSGTSGDGTKQTPTDASGGMIEARYLKSGLRGLGMSYEFNLENTTYVPNGTACFYDCSNPVTTLASKDSKLIFEWVPSIVVGRMRPFAIGGVGFFISSSDPSMYGTGSSATMGYQVNTVVRPTYVFGGGSDFSLTSRFGVRLQYRYNLYKAPNLSAIYPATGAWTGSSEPMGGVFYRF